MPKKVTIPINDDLGVYSRMLIRYWNEPTRVHYQCMLLAQRVLIEKGKQTYKKRHQMSRVYDLIGQLNDNRNLVEAYATMLRPGSRLGNVYPQYVEAGLVP